MPKIELLLFKRIFKSLGVLLWRCIRLNVGGLLGGTSTIYLKCRSANRRFGNIAFTGREEKIYLEGVLLAAEFVVTSAVPRLSTPVMEFNGERQLALTYQFAAVESEVQQQY